MDHSVSNPAARPNRPGRRSSLSGAKLLFASALAGSLVLPVLAAGIRGPGKYNRVVFYDRWDNCYLFSGVYLMYVSETAKETLRPYRGASIEIDAKEVYQPMNPGDGLIERLMVVGPSKETARSTPVGGVKLRAGVSNIEGAVRATVEIRNAGPSPISFTASALVLALFPRKEPGHAPLLHCPADGTSCAVVTRASSAHSSGMNVEFSID